MSLPRQIGDERVADDTRIVTYVARGLEAMRGFDIFVRIAHRVAAVMPNVVFAVVGADRVAYGNDLRHVKARSFREHVLATERPAAHRPLARAGRALVESRYGIEITLPRLWKLFTSVLR